jgi:SAM-dependent methyltransferase
VSSRPSRQNVGDTIAANYARRLVTMQRAWWKRVTPVQLPYRWNIRRLCPGQTLEIGCGIGRNLKHLRGGAIGIDHNPEAVRIARERRLEAYTPEEFASSHHERPDAFDSLLFAHALEHMDRLTSLRLIRTYLPCLRRTGTVVMITPQERGFRSDPTHLVFLDFAGLTDLANACGLRVTRQFSFPFPRRVGTVFTYNEFVVVAQCS